MEIFGVESNSAENFIGRWTVIDHHNCQNDAE